MIKNLNFFVGVVAICNVENEGSQPPQKIKGNRFACMLLSFLQGQGQIISGYTRLLWNTYTTTYIYYNIHILWHLGLNNQTTNLVQGVIVLFLSSKIFLVVSNNEPFSKCKLFTSEESFIFLWYLVNVSSPLSREHSLKSGSTQV